MTAAIKTDNLYSLCKIGDVSLQGLFIKTGTPIRHDETVNIMVYGPNGKFGLHATVVHSGDSGAGLMIEEFDSDALSEWKGVVESVFAEFETAEMMSSMH